MLFLNVVNVSGGTWYKHDDGVSGEST